MDINGWLTVITVFTAIFALIPREDLTLSFRRTHLWEKYSVFIIVVMLIPYLIVFPKLVYRIPCLNYFCFKNGFQPDNVAFFLFYICFIWLIVRLFWVKPKLKADKESIKDYLEFLNEKSFEDFFKLFTKYTSNRIINKEWESYQQIILSPKFLSGVITKEPTYLLQFWDKFSTETKFQSVFRLFLENEKSAYYIEIREHWNSYSLLDDKPFLNKILKENIRQSIHNGLLMLFSDFVARHLKGEHDKTSIYNQQHYYPRIREEEGFDLPVYYHVHFIGLLYSSAIEHKIDISTLSSRYTNMQSIYSSMVADMIDNIVVVESNKGQEYPTNYHWLISEIFSFIDNWLTSFIEERNYTSNSSYVEFIPFSFSLCIGELYKGFTRGKISQEFINSMVYYHALSDYFGYSINDEMKSSIERNIIERIPEEHLESIFDFALDEKFAISFNQFMSENFGHTNSREQEILRRLYNFLQGNN